uniref:Phosphoinositide interacting regulator of transient receptor potential channels n=1 Tax=Sphaeramia orbicularis TaxID=375764 RepID=A0A672Z1F9_9TELE
MLSSVVTTSTMEPSSQDADTGASTTLSPLQDVDPSPAPPCGLLYWRPLLAMAVGALMFGSGTVVSLLYFTRVGHVPYLLGPLFLSVGLMLLVTGLVWIPMLKQSLEHKKYRKISMKLQK